MNGERNVEQQQAEPRDCGASEVASGHRSVLAVALLLSIGEQTWKSRIGFEGLGACVNDDYWFGRMEIRI